MLSPSAITPAVDTAFLNHFFTPGRVDTYYCASTRECATNLDRLATQRPLETDGCEVNLDDDGRGRLIAGVLDHLEPDGRRREVLAKLAMTRASRTVDQTAEVKTAEACIEDHAACAAPNEAAPPQPASALSETMRLYATYKQVGPIERRPETRPDLSLHYRIPQAVSVLFPAPLARWAVEQWEQTGHTDPTDIFAGYRAIRGEPNLGNVASEDLGSLTCFRHAYPGISEVSVKDPEVGVLLGSYPEGEVPVSSLASWVAIVMLSLAPHIIGACYLWDAAAWLRGRRQPRPTSPTPGKDAGPNAGQT